MNILLVEPDSVFAKIITSYLSTKQHKIVWESSAQSAISSVDQFVPDVVVLELLLPDHNGMEFLYEFRSYPEWQSIPVIIYSFVPEVSLSPYIRRQLGIVNFFYKPYSTLQQLEFSLAQPKLVSI